MADVESAASVDNAGDVAGAARVHSSTTNEEDGPDVSPRQTGNAAAAAHSDTDGATDIEQLRASLRALEAREFKAFVKIKQLESERDQLLAEKRDGDKSGEAISASVNVSTLRTLKTMRQKLELAERQRDELEVRCRELEGQVGRLRGPETHAEGDPQRALRVEERLQQLLADFGEGYQHKLAQAPSEVGKGDSPPHIAFAIKKVAALQTELAETQERLQEALAGKGALLSSFTNREPPQSPTSPMSPIERVHSDVSGDVDSPMLATHASSESLLLQRKLSKAEADRDAAQRTASVLRKTVMDLKRKREKGPAGDAGGQSVFEDLHKENLRLRREVQEVQQQRRVAEQAIEGLKTHLPDLPSSEDGDAQERLSDNDILAAIPEADRYAVRTLGCYMGVERAAAALRCADGNIGLATSRLSDDRRIVTEKKKTRLMRNHDADRAAFETHENDRRAAEEQLEGSARRDMCRWEEEARLRVHKAEETLYFIRARKAHDALLACGREEFGARGGVELVQQGAWEYIFRAEEQARLLPRGSPSKGADLVALRARVAELEALLAAERVRQPAGPGTPPRDRSPEASSPDELSPAGGHASDDAGGVPGLSEQEKIDVLDAELRTVTERLRDEKHRTAGLEARVAEVCSMEARLRAAEVERDVYRKSTQDLQTTLEEMKVEQMALSQQAEADRRTRDEELAGVREELRAAQQLLEEKALALTSAGQKLRDADASTGAARDRLTASETRCAALETALVAAEVGNGSNGDGGNDALAASAQRSKRLELDMARLHEELTNVAAAAARDKAAREGDVSALRVALAEKADELKRAEDDGAAAREAAATSVAQVKEVSQRCAELERENVSLRARVTSELEGIAIKREKSSGETEVEVDDKSEAPSRGSAPPHHKRVPSKYSAWDISRATTLEPGAGRAQLTQDANDFALVSPTTATESMMPAWDGVPLAGGDAVAKQNEALHTQTERLRREQERLEGEAKEHEQRCEDLLQLISAMDAAAAEEARSDVHSLPDSTATLKALVVALREEVSDTQQQRDRAESKLRDAEAMKTAPGNVDGDAATDDPVQHNGDEQEARLAAAVKQCTDLHADLAEARAEGEARRGELEGKLADAMRREGELRATAVEADRRLSRMQDELDEAVRRGRAAAARVDALEEELYATRQQADATVEAVKAHTTAAEMQIAELTDDRDKQLAGMQAAVDEARRLQREVGARCEDLERQLGAAEGRAEELLSIMADSSDAVERAANDQTLQLEGLRAALESARAQQRTDKARCESLEGELVAAEARVEEMRSQVAHGRAAVDEAARRGVMVEALQGELEAAREAQRREAARRGELEQRLAAAETRGAELRELSVEGDTELEVMRGALRSYKESRDGERTRCEDLEKKLEAAEAHVTELRAEISSTAADHNVQLDALRNKLDACRVQQDAASARCAELEEKLVAAEARAEELEAQLVGARRDGEEDLSEGAREELRVLETALSEAKERQHKEEARRMELERGLAAAEARVAELLERDHSEQADALRGELEECSKQHSADRERCGELEGKLAAAEARVGESGGASGYSADGEDLREELNRAELRIADLEAKLSTMRDGTDAGTDTHATEESSALPAATVLRDLEDAKAQRVEMERRYEDVRAQLEAASVQLELLQNVEAGAALKPIAGTEALEEGLGANTDSPVDASDILCAAAVADALDVPRHSPPPCGGAGGTVADDSGLEAAVAAEQVVAKRLHEQLVQLRGAVGEAGGSAEAALAAALADSERLRDTQGAVAGAAAALRAAQQRLAEDLEEKDALLAHIEGEYRDVQGMLEDAEQASLTFRAAMVRRLTESELRRRDLERMVTPDADMPREPQAARAEPTARPDTRAVDSRDDISTGSCGGCKHEQVSDASADGLLRLLNDQCDDLQRCVAGMRASREGWGAQDTSDDGARSVSEPCGGDASVGTAERRGNIEKALELEDADECGVELIEALQRCAALQVAVNDLRTAQASDRSEIAWLRDRLQRERGLAPPPPSAPCAARNADPSATHGTSPQFVAAVEQCSRLHGAVAATGRELEEWRESPARQRPADYRSTDPAGVDALTARCALLEGELAAAHAAMRADEGELRRQLLEALEAQWALENEMVMVKHTVAGGRRVRQQSQAASEAMIEQLEAAEARVEDAEREMREQQMMNSLRRLMENHGATLVVDPNHERGAPLESVPLPDAPHEACAVASVANAPADHGAATQEALEGSCADNAPSTAHDPPPVDVEDLQRRLADAELENELLGARVGQKDKLITCLRELGNVAQQDEATRTALQARIDKLERQNSALREELEDVEDRLNSAMTRNDSLEDALCADDDGQHELINTLKRCEELDVQLAHTRRDLDMARGEVETLREQCGTAQTQGKDLIDALRQCEELEDELRECRVRMGESEGQLGAALNRNDALENALCDNSPNETAEQLIDALKRCEELETALHEAESIAKTEPPASARSVSTDTTERDNRQLRQLLDERQHDLNVALQRQMEFENVVEALQADLQEMTAQCAAQSKALNSLGTGERKERLVEALRQVEELADCEGQPDTDVAQPQGASSAEGKIAEDPDLPGDMNTPPAGSIDAAEGGELRGAGTAAELPGSTASDDASSSACEEAEAAAQQVSHRTELVQRLAASERRRLELEDALEELMDVLARRPSGASAVLADPPQGTDAAAAAVPPDPAPVPPTDSDIIDAIVAVVQREQQQQTAAFKQEVSALHATIGTLQEQVCELSPRSNSVPHRHDEPGNIRDSLMISSEGVATAPASTMDDLSWQLEDAEAALQAAADMRQRLVEELQRRRPTGASEASPLPSPPGAPARSPALTDEAHDALVERLDAACARVAAAETQCTELRDANHVLQEEIAAVRDVEAQLKASQARCADLEAQQQSLAARLEAQDPCGSDAYGALHDRMADLRSQLQAAEQAATAAKAKASAADVQSRALLVHATQLEGRIDSAEGQAAALKDSLEQSQQALHTTEAQLKESKTLCTAVEASNTSLREEVAGTREHAAQLAAQCDAKTRWAEELTAMVDAHKQRCDDLVTAVEAQEQRATAAAAEVADLRGSLAVRDAELQKAEDQCGELQRTVDSLLHEPPVTPVSGVDDAGTFMGQGVEFRTELVQRLAASEKRRTDVESALEDITQLLAVRVADAAPTPTPPQAPSEEPHDVLSAALGLLQAHQQRGHVCASEAGTSDGVFAGETARRLAAVSASQPPVDSEVPPPALPPARLERPGNRGDDETTRLLKRSEERCKALEDTVRAQALTLQRSTEWLPDAASPQRSRETRALLDEAQTCCSDLASAVQELRQASSPQRGPRDELDATRRHCERLQCAVEAMERELRGRAPPRELIDGLSHPQTKYLLDAANRRCRKLQSVVAAQAANLARLEVAKAELEAAVVEVEHQRAALVQQRGGDAEAESTRLAKRCAELEATVESLAHDLAAREDVGGGSPATSKMLRERAAEAEEQRDVLAHRVKSLEAVCANLRRNFAAKLDELVGQGEAVSPRRVVQDRAAARRVGGAGDAPVRPPIARVGGAAEVLLSPPPCEHDDAADADEVERDAHAAAGHLNSAITALRGRLASKVKELETLERSPAGSPRAAALPMSRLLGNTGGGGTAAGHPPR